MFVISSNLLSMLGKSKLLLFNISISAVLNFLLNMYLVPKYGIDGASIATMICSILLAAMFLFEANYHTAIIPLKRKMFNVLFSAAIPTIAFLFIRPYIQINLFSVILVGIIFLAVYACLILLTKSLDRNDLLIWESVKKKASSIKHLIYAGEIKEDID